MNRPEGTPSRPPARRLLSARSTALYRALPVLWLLAVAAVAWTARSEPGLGVVLIPVALVPPLLMRWQMGKLRRVSTDSRMLYVSEGGREVSIPFSEIAEVREIHGTGRNRVTTVTLVLRSQTPLGREIRFVPRMRWWPDADSLSRAQAVQRDDPDAAARALWGSLSVAEEIRQRVQAAGRSGADPFDRRDLSPGG